MRMVRRFLQYSLDHQCSVKALFADTMKFQNIRVTSIDGDQVSFLRPGRKKPITKNIEEILSASYARGDDGDTLQYARAEEKDE